MHGLWGYPDSLCDAGSSYAVLSQFDTDLRAEFHCVRQFVLGSNYRILSCDHSVKAITGEVIVVHVHCYHSVIIHLRVDKWLFIGYLFV